MTRHTLSLSFLAVSLLSALACAGSKVECEDDEVKEGGACVPADADADADTDTDADPDGDDAPQILTFSSNVNEIVSGESVIFTAVVTDPQGISDLIGGTLLSEGGATYGSFATSSEEGAYTLTISWDDMNEVESINFDSEEDRTFIGRFYDEAGNITEDEISIQLHCSDATHGACEGSCRSLQTDIENCGSCGNVCEGSDLLGYTVCDAGTCVEDVCTTSLRDTCSDVCGDEGMSCFNDYFDVAGYVIDTDAGTCASWNGDWYDANDYDFTGSCTERLDSVLPSGDFAICVCGG